MAIPRHNAHMKIAQHIWDRAQACAILAGQSMTMFTEEALAALSASRTNNEEDENDEQSDSEVSR